MQLQKQLNWEVLEKSLMLENGQAVHNGKALVRSDNNRVLEVVNSNFNPLKNSELINIIKIIAEKEKLSENDIKIIETNEGQKISVIVNLDYNMSVGNDKVANQLLIQNSHGGFTSLKLGFGTLVASCSNGMVIFNKNIDHKIYHNQFLKFEIERLLNNVEYVKTNIRKFNEFSNEIIEKKIDDRQKIILEAINHVANVDLSISKEEYLKNYKPQYDKNIALYKWNSAGLMRESILSEMNYKGDNYWGLLNGFTYYNTHRVNVKNRNNFNLNGFGLVITKELSSLSMKKWE